MAFQSVWTLLWLLPLTGAIVALYLLKMRRRDVRVPATFLWPALTADIRANAPLQKLRVSLLLLLQLLIACLLVISLANPLRRSRGLHGNATVVVLDSSASMAATDVAPSRFEAARRRLLGMVETTGAGDRLALIEAGPATRVLFGLESDRAKRTAAVRGLRPSDAPNNLGEALRLAAALVGQRPGGRIVVLSDGAFAPVTDFSPGKAQLLFEPVGTSGRNLAVTAFEAGDAPQGIALFAGVRNYGDVRQKATLTFTVDGRVADARSIDIPPRQTIGQTRRVPATARRAEVRLTADGNQTGNYLTSDDRAGLFLQAAGTVRTLLITPGNLFLERALALEPSVRLDRAPVLPPHERASTTGKGRYDLVLFDGVEPQPVKAPAVWSFGEIAPHLPVEGVGLSRRPRVAAQASDHPVLRHANLDELLIEKARKVRVKPEGRVLLQGSDGPLIVAGERGAHRSLFVAWNLLESDFPLRVAFPIFVGNAVAWLTGNGRAGDDGGLSVRAGQPFTIATPGDAPHVTLVNPNGDRTRLDAAGGVVVVRVADVVGDYVLAGPNRQTALIVNLLDEAESDIAPRSVLDLGGRSVAGRGSSLVLAETWRPLALLALLVLAAEWWVFVRKS